MPEIQPDIETLKERTATVAHAPLAPSYLNIAFNCQASLIPLEKPIPDRDTEYSREGTLAHLWLERGLKEGGRVLGQCENDEMRTHVVELLRLITQIKDKVGRPAIYKELIEERVYFSEYLFGTIDWAILYVRKGQKCIYALDLKYGQGTPVSAVNNPQLLAYAYLTTLTHDWSAKRATLAIYQPRNSENHDKPLEQWQLTEKDIKAFAAKLRRFEPKALRILSGELRPKPVTGSWCKFCKRKPICPAFRKLASSGGLLLIENAAPIPSSSEGRGATRRIAPKKPEELDDSQIDYLLENADLVRVYLKDVETYAAGRMLSQYPLANWKLVEGRRQRKWIDNTQTPASYLQEHNIQPFKETLIGITEAERLLGGKLPKDLTTFTNPKHKLVSKDDPRPAIEKPSVDLLDELTAAGD